MCQFNLPCSGHTPVQCRVVKETPKVSCFIKLRWWFLPLMLLLTDCVSSMKWKPMFFLVLHRDFILFIWFLRSCEKSWYCQITEEANEVMHLPVAVFHYAFVISFFYLFFIFKLDYTLLKVLAKFEALLNKTLKVPESASLFASPLIRTDSYHIQI